jgi:hypothetical protein
LFGDGGDFPLGMVVAVGFVGIDDIFSEFGHVVIKI